MWKEAENGVKNVKRKEKCKKSWRKEKIRKWNGKAKQRLRIKKVGRE